MADWHPHMFVAAGSRFAEDLCGVELLDPPTTDRARELAEIHAGHGLERCPVLRVALESVES
ncbi:MAG: hypothetical protein J2P17_09305 [Mycobacterium sp.]|nr:hypothetical protein [Mycobacterium sp.]